MIPFSRLPFCCTTEVWWFVFLDNILSSLLTGISCFYQSAFEFFSERFMRSTVVKTKAHARNNGGNSGNVFEKAIWILWGFRVESLQWFVGLMSNFFDELRVERIWSWKMIEIRVIQMGWFWFLKDFDGLILKINENSGSIHKWRHAGVMFLWPSS